MYILPQVVKSDIIVRIKNVLAYVSKQALVVIFLRWVTLIAICVESN